MKSRRNFLKQSGIAIGAMMTQSSFGNITVPSEQASQATSETCSFPNGINLELKSEKSFFRGIGEVKCGDILLRSGRRPMFVEITTPDGIRFMDYTVKNKEFSDNQIKLTFSMQQTTTELMEWMLHTVRNRRNLGDWTESPQPAADTELQLIIKPLTREIDGEKWTGFTYQYLYQSKKYPIYRILDRATWEIGGNIIGNEFWNRNGVVPSLIKFNDSQQFYSGEWYLPGIENPNIFQFHPLQTTLQGFTFTASPEGVLLTWSNEVAHVNSLFEKQTGKNEMAHYHEHCGDLVHNFATSPVEVLFRKGNTNHVEKANIYESCKETVYETLHQKAGLRRERVSSYGVIEEWGIPDMNKYIDEGLPKLVEAGMKTVFLPNECENAMNVYGVSNMCCNVDYKIAETVGEDKMRAFCAKARENGVVVEMWGNTAISSLTEMFSYREQGATDRLKRLAVEGSIMEVVNKAKMPWIRNASNAIEADHYTPRFCALNMRDPDIYKYWMDCWKKLHDDIGITGIFLDSSFNMTSNKFHHVQNMETKRIGGATLDQKENLGFFRPREEPLKGIFSQYRAHIDMIRDMQKMGYIYCGEDIGVFGVHRSGPCVDMRFDCMHIWTDCIADFDIDLIKKAGYNPVDILFKGIAYRMMWFVHWNPNTGELVTQPGGKTKFPQFTFFKIFNEVEKYMFNRRILDDEKGVVYHHDGKTVLWAFTDFDYPIKLKQIVKNMETKKLTKTNIIKAKKNNVYLIG